MANKNTEIDLRDRPTVEFMRRMTKLYPVEKEIEGILHSKLERRIQPSASSYSLDELEVSIRAMLHEKLNDEFSIQNMRWLSGGASKIQIAFELNWMEPNVGRTTTSMVLRMEPVESLNSTSRRREFQLLNYFRNIIPVPRVYWLDADAQWFPQPAFVYAFAEGVTKPAGMKSSVSGIGLKFPEKLRGSLGIPFVEHLARIHSQELDHSQLTAFDIPAVDSTESALLQLNRARRVWEEDRGYEFPIFEVATNWLSRNLPKLDRPSILHGEYRAGNFLFDEATEKITAWLDWERGYIGDRHRDLAWTMSSSFGSYAEDGSTFLVSGLIPIDDFFAKYERLSGLTVDPKRLKFYRILNTYQMMVTTIATAYRLIRLGKTHQDVLIAWVEGVGYSQAEVLRGLLKEEIVHAK
ncbi:phosphotransferase family protein [Psychrobacillus sp. NPDC096426]|uniref:phosphotransferase family protein n=1 Tax=Psychrobacillus sp. NPDC096426 TaxID=3364491 RepID=UPI00380435A3